MNDKGGNFGRFARTGLMSDYIDKLIGEEIAGIPIKAWQGFLSIFSESWTEEKVIRALDQLASQYAQRKSLLTNETIDRIRERLLEIADLLAL